MGKLKDSDVLEVSDAQLILKDLETIGIRRFIAVGLATQENREKGLEIKSNSYTCTKTPASNIKKKGWNLNQQNLSKIYTCVKAF